MQEHLLNLSKIFNDRNMVKVTNARTTGGATVFDREREQFFVKLHQDQSNCGAGGMVRALVTLTMSLSLKILLKLRPKSTICLFVHLVYFLYYTDAKFCPFSQKTEKKGLLHNF